MELHVTLAVLGAAVCHATWNALLKTGGDAVVRVAVVNGVAGLCALPILVWLGLPAPASWPWVATSAVVHLAYFATLTLAYRGGDLSLVYPVARGAAPLLVALGAWVVAGERLTLAQSAAVAMVCAGILALAFGGGRRAGAVRSVAWALGTSLTIAAYSVADGIGGRLAGDVRAYVAMLFVLNAPPYVILALVLRRRALARALARDWRGGVVAGVLAFAGYGIAIWAMTRAPMTMVSALRETSVLIAALIGTRILGEGFGARRIGAALLVTLGVVVLQILPADG